MFFPGFLFISTHISLHLLSLISADLEAYIGLGGKLNGHLLASCVGNIHTKNYQHLIIDFQAAVKNVGDALWNTSVRTIYITILFALQRSKNSTPQLMFYNSNTSCEYYF